MNDCPVVLIGGGGHALSVLAALPPDIRAMGYVDRAPSPVMGERLPWLGDDERFLNDNATCRHSILITLVSDASCSLSTRRKVIERYKDFASPVMIAPTAIVADDASVDVGTMVMHRAVVNTATTVGRHCIINTGAIVEHGCNIGSNVFIGPGAVICGEVTIGNDVYIGAGAVLRPGVQICDGAVVGLGAAVVASIENQGVYAGCPAKMLK